MIPLPFVVLKRGSVVHDVMFLGCNEERNWGTTVCGGLVETHLGDEFFADDPSPALMHRHCKACLKARKTQPSAGGGA